MGVLRVVAACVLEHDFHAEGTAAGHLHDPSGTHSPHRRADRYREVLTGVPVRPPRTATAVRRRQFVRLDRRDPVAVGEARLRLVQPDGPAARTGGDRRVRLPLELRAGRLQLLLDVRLQSGELDVALLQRLPLGRGPGLIRREPGLGPLVLGDRVVHREIGLREGMLTSHQSLGTVGQDHLGGHRQPPTAAVLRPRDPAQILVQGGDVPPLRVQERLRSLGFGTLVLGLLASGLVLLRRHRGLLVQPHDLSAEAGGRADAGAGVAPGVLAGRRRPGRQHGQRAQQDRNEQPITAI